MKTTELVARAICLQNHQHKQDLSWANTPYYMDAAQAAMDAAQAAITAHLYAMKTPSRKTLEGFAHEIGLTIEEAADTWAMVISAAEKENGEI